MAPHCGPVASAARPTAADAGRTARAQADAMPLLLKPTIALALAGLLAACTATAPRQATDLPEPGEVSPRQVQ
jgi:hypothetical protein